MDIQIDISGNVKDAARDSFLGAAEKEGTYKRSVHLPASVKKKIKNYRKYRDEIHVCLVYLLIKDELAKYSSIHLCNDIGKNSLHNKLLKVFKDDEYYNKLRLDKKIRIAPVGHDNCEVDKYVKRLKKGKELPTKRIGYEELNEILQYFK